MNLAMAAALMDQYDTELGMWDGASRINTIMLYREERGRDGKFHLKPVDAPDVHFLKEFSAGSQLLVLEDWFSPVHVGLIGLKTEGYWLGFCVIGTPLLTSFLDNLWMDFLIALVCFMVGILLISSYFRVLDEQYETELRRRKMSDAMAHEMKTPLGIIKNYSEALMEEEDAETRDQYLNTIVEETDGMNHMIVQMLDLSKMEAGTYPLKLSMLSVNRIAEEIVKRTEILMKPKGLQVELSLAEETLILADEKLLEESISNLMLNAIRYSETGSTIKLSVSYEAGGARIAVENRGPQIAEKDGQHIWESFYRGDEARSRERGGNGLGLSIAANTCALHRGSYGFENLEHGVRLMEIFIFLPIFAKKAYRLQN